MKTIIAKVKQTAKVNYISTGSLVSDLHSLYFEKVQQMATNFEKDFMNNVSE